MITGAHPRAFALPGRASQAARLLRHLDACPTPAHWQGRRVRFAVPRRQGGGTPLSVMDGVFFRLFRVGWIEPETAQARRPSRWRLTAMGRECLRQLEALETTP